jgi:hypothetical protein
MARIETSKGEAVLRPMLAKDEILIGELAELEDTNDASAYYRIKARMVRALDEATQRADWEGGFGELPKDEILVSLIKWDRGTEEEALPPDNGTSSETPSPAGT